MDTAEKEVIKNEKGESIERLKAELEKTRLKLDILLDNIPGGVFTYDADSGKIDYISRGVLSIFQCSPLPTGTDTLPIPYTGKTGKISTSASPCKIPPR